MIVRTLTNGDLTRVLPDLARLRMAVFRDWPYLYAGSFDYEHRYLQSYRDSAGAVIVGAFDGDTLVGAATGTPLEDHSDDVARAFDGTGLVVGNAFYCAESVLLPAYRGRGIGHAFFDAREDWARALGRKTSVFCAVERPDNHPDRPAAYTSLASFWRKRGYQPIAGVKTTMSWTDLGATTETAKPMQFWSRSL